jgi:uncharacterized protein YggE
MNGTTMTARMIAVACTAICLSAGGADRAAAATPRTITVTGNGTVTGTPDELKLSLDAAAQAASVSAALDQANQAMAAIRDALIAHHVAPADLQTAGMSVQPQYNQRNTITGYTVSESLTAELHNLATAGQTISDAIRAGGNAARINDVSLDLADQMATLMAKARARAITDARNQAQQFAKAAGMRLGRVLSITATGTSAVPRPPIPGMLFAAASPVPISAGTQQITTSVVVVYQMRS